MLSRIVAKLEARELITRTSDSSDARVIHVAPTAKALELRDTIRHERTDALQYGLSRLSEKDIEILSAAAPVLEALVVRLRERTQ
jgi:DNA-binding MarR family transcriptional regulator